MLFKLHELINTYTNPGVLEPQLSLEKRDKIREIFSLLLRSGNLPIELPKELVNIIDELEIAFETYVCSSANSSYTEMISANSWYMDKLLEIQAEYYDSLEYSEN